MKWWWASKANCFLKLGKITSLLYHIITAFCSTWFTKQMTHYYFPQKKFSNVVYKSAFETYFLWNICTRLKKYSEMGNKGRKMNFPLIQRPSHLPYSPPTVTNCATIFKKPQEGLVNLAPGPNLVCPFLLRKSDWNTTMPICLDLAYGRFHTYDDRVSSSKETTRFTKPKYLLSVSIENVCNPCSRGILSQNLDTWHTYS